MADTISRTKRVEKDDSKRGGYSGSGSAATMKPPAKLPSAAMKPKPSEKK
jgi:hypothetical protein